MFFTIKENDRDQPWSLRLPYVATMSPWLPAAREWNLYIVVVNSDVVLVQQWQPILTKEFVYYWRKFSSHQRKFTRKQCTCALVWLSFSAVRYLTQMPLWYFLSFSGKLFNLAGKTSVQLNHWDQNYNYCNIFRKHVLFDSSKINQLKVTSASGRSRTETSWNHHRINSTKLRVETTSCQCIMAYRFFWDDLPNEMEEEELRYIALLY